MGSIEIPTEILRGGQMLDAIAPAWFWYIDMRRLDLGSDKNCILGQLARYHPDVRTKLRRVPFDGEPDFTDLSLAIRFGAFPEYSHWRSFDLRGYGFIWASPGDWCNLIALRRAGTAVCIPTQGHLPAKGVQKGANLCPIQHMALTEQDRDDLLIAQTRQDMEREGSLPGGRMAFGTLELRRRIAALEWLIDNCEGAQ